MGSDLEQATIAQAQRAARLPFIAGHVALMPDAFVGMGATIGSVIPTVGAVIPSAVGVDIGCGMIAVECPFESTALPDSCSHGAGRRMPRGQARRELDLDTFRAEMAGKTWLADNAEGLLDEDPRSYKDIDQVIADQADLVRPDHTLTQVLNYKGL